MRQRVKAPRKGERREREKKRPKKKRRVFHFYGECIKSKLGSEAGATKYKRHSLAKSYLVIRETFLREQNRGFQDLVHMMRSPYSYSRRDDARIYDHLGKSISTKEGKRDRGREGR